jgi:hypothetical protein
VPELRDLLSEPARVADLTHDEALVAVERLAALLSALAARLRPESPPAKPEAQPAQDRLLTAREAAERLGVKERWLRDHPEVRGRVMLSPRRVRYSAAGIDREIRARAGTVR